MNPTTPDAVFDTLTDLCAGQVASVTLADGRTIDVEVVDSPNTRRTRAGHGKVNVSVEMGPETFQSHEDFTSARGFLHHNHVASQNNDAEIVLWDADESGDPVETPIDTLDAVTVE